MHYSSLLYTTLRYSVLLCATLGVPRVTMGTQGYSKVPIICCIQDLDFNILKVPCAA
jgi:hypothetical protein